MLRKAYLEITNVCNLKCSFCPGTKREKRFMSPAEFETLAGKLRPYTEYLYLHLMGEPLLHPELTEILAISGKLKFKVIITTNGSLLDTRGEQLLQSGAVHKVNISLQSFEANGVGDLTEYLTGCLSFAQMAAQAGKICVLRLWNRNGLDKLNGIMEGEMEKSFPKPWQESGRGIALSERIWLEHGDKFDWPELTADYTEKACFCYGLRDQIGVLCDGTVVPCCLDREGDIPLGNLFTEDLNDIMSTQRAKEIYKGFSERRAVEPLCQHCGYAKRFT